MAKIKRITYTDEFRRCAAASTAHGEFNDCSVKAIALVAGITYAEAHAACASNGRQPRRGMHVWSIYKTLKDLGINRQAVDERAIIDTYPGVHKNLQSVTTRHPHRFPTSWADGTYLIITKRHIAAVVDGVCHDWAADKALRAEAVWRVWKS